MIATVHGDDAMRAQSLYGSTLFEVKIVKDLTTQRVVVDPATGKVAAVPSRGKRKDDDD